MCKNRRKVATRVRDGSESHCFYIIFVKIFVIFCKDRADLFYFFLFKYRDYLSRIIIKSEDSPRSLSRVSAYNKYKTYQKDRFLSKI